MKFKRMGEKNSKIKKSGQLLKLSSEPYTYGHSCTHVNSTHTQHKTDILSLSVFTALAMNPLSCWRSYQMLAPTRSQATDPPIRGSHMRSRLPDTL